MFNSDNTRNFLGGLSKKREKEILEVLESLLGEDDTLFLPPLSDISEISNSIITNSDFSNSFRRVLNNTVKNIGELLSVINTNDQYNKETGPIYINYDNQTVTLKLPKLTSVTSFDSLEDKSFNKTLKSFVLENLYNELKDSLPFNNLEEFNLSISTLLSNPSYKNKDQDVNEFNKFLGGASKSYYSDLLENAFVENLLDLDNKLEKTSKTDKKYKPYEPYQGTKATITSIAMHTIVFPLDSEDYLKYKDHPEFIELHNLVKEVYFLENIEIDMSHSKGKESKNLQAKKVIKMLNELSSIKIPDYLKQFIIDNSKVDMKLRLLGNYGSKVNGLFVPESNQSEAAPNERQLMSSIIALDVKNSTAGIHEFTHYIEDVMKKFIKECPDHKKRSEVVNQLDYLKKVVSILSTHMNLNYDPYYSDPKEILARLVEYSYALMHGNNDVINIVKDIPFYNKYSNIYSDINSMDGFELKIFENLSTNFFDNFSIGKDIEVKDSYSLLLSKSKAKQASKQRSFEQLALSSFLKVLRGYTPQVITHFLNDLKSKDNSGENTYLNHISTANLLITSLANGNLSPFNNKSSMTTPERTFSREIKHDMLVSLLDFSYSLPIDQQKDLINSLDFKTISYIHTKTISDYESINLHVINNISSLLADKINSNVDLYKDDNAKVDYILDVITSKYTYLENGHVWFNDFDHINSTFSLISEIKKSVDFIDELESTFNDTGHITVFDEQDIMRVAKYQDFNFPVEIDSYFPEFNAKDRFEKMVDDKDFDGLRKIYSDAIQISIKLIDNEKFIKDTMPIKEVESPIKEVEIPTNDAKIQDIV
jgi:hypothetical protein